MIRCPDSDDEGMDLSTDVGVVQCVFTLFLVFAERGGMPWPVCERLSDEVLAHITIERAPEVAKGIRSLVTKHLSERKNDD